jgi:serine/threonine protein kinase
MMEVFSIGSLILLIPFLVNLWVVRGHGADIIVEGKEFNRLAKLSVKSLPYELHGLYTDAVYLGEGGFGRVYKAKRVDSGEEVAIKIPKSFDKRAEKTFIAEVSNWSQLDHPHIVQLFKYKILPIPYIETELCDGALPHGQKSINDTVNIIYDIAHGLSYAHHKNIIHGDVKTSNIMVCSGLYKISDWGLSKLKIGESVTLSGATPQYAAPEQISQEYGKADERTDIYQLGTVFYELVTGKVPFEGDMSEVYGSILNKEPILPSEINAQSKDLEPIIMKCLNKVKDERYSSMEELLKDLEDYRQPSDDTVIMPEE